MDKLVVHAPSTPKAQPSCVCLWVSAGLFDCARADACRTYVGISCPIDINGYAELHQVSA